MEQLMMLFMMMFFIGSIQPMIMIASLILMVICYSYNIYMWIGGYWFSYALLMVMLSGVLVVFTYMVSLMPNESFESYNLLYIILFMMMVMKYYMSSYMMDTSVVSLVLWISYFGMFNMFMVSFLLSIMLMVVWFSYMDEGAMYIN